MNKKNPLFTSCDHKEDCTCDNVFNELTPINPAQARQKLDCLTMYRKLLERAKAVLVNLSEYDILEEPEIQLIHDINEALKEESEK